MHTIRGVNGVIARALSQALSAHMPDIRHMGRNPRKANPTDGTCVADLPDAQATADAAAGSKRVCLAGAMAARDAQCGLQAACEPGAFDNAYAYGRVDGVMAEDTPFNPTSRKGEARAPARAGCRDGRHHCRTSRTGR